LRVTQFDQLSRVFNAFLFRSSLMRQSVRALVVAVALALPVAARAQSDSGKAGQPTHVLRLKDGSTLMGHLVSRDSAGLRFETMGNVLSIPADRVAELSEVRAGDMHGNDYWFPDPNRTRLFFSPTARMLKAGEGYYSNTYLLLQNFAVGSSANFTMGGGFSVLPSSDFLSDNAYYVTPKVGLFQSDENAVAVGALVGFVPADHGHTGGIVYGVGTHGGEDASVTGGLGYAFADGNFTPAPILMLGGTSRVSRRIALVTENYGYFHNGDGGAVFSYGIRILGEKLSADLAFWNSKDTHVFPGIPYVAFAVKF
jgi:hypothetical protein